MSSELTTSFGDNSELDHLYCSMPLSLNRFLILVQKYSEKQTLQHDVWAE